MYDYENSPEQDLIRRARRGDIKAFSQLYARIYKDLYKFALYMTRHTQDAEDAVSEAVLSAYENLSNLRKEDSFRSWMFTILNNCYKKMLRAKGNNLITPEGIEIEGLPFFDAEAEAEAINLETEENYDFLNQLDIDTLANMYMPGMKNLRIAMHKSDAIKKLIRETR